MKNDAKDKKSVSPNPSDLPQELQESSKASSKFYLLVVFSSLIATFGLIADSSSVVIGAMLVAPLMTPIQGFALGAVRGRRPLLLHAASALSQGFVVAFALSILTAWLALKIEIDALPYLPQEAALRTNPNPVDLAVALAGGAVSAFAIARMPDSQALPGVAISTALMPPLCTVGIGVALQDPSTINGAAIFFLTNLSAVVFAGVVVFVLLGFRPERENGWMPSIVTVALGAMVGVTLVAMTLRVSTEGHQSDRVRSAVLSALDEHQPGSELLEMDQEDDGETLLLRVTVQTTPGISMDEIATIHATVTERLRRPVALDFAVVPRYRVGPATPAPSP